MFIVHRIVFVINVFAALLLLVSYAAPYVSPEVYWPLAFLGLAYPILLLINALFVIYWIVFFRLQFLFSLTAILIGYKHLPYIAQINAKKTNDYSNTIRYVSFNVKSFGAYDKKEVEDADRFIDVLDKVNPDVICFQEFANYNTRIEGPVFKKVFNRLKNYYSYNTFTSSKGKYKSGRMLVVFSRFPIIDSGEVEHVKGIHNFTVFTDIVAHGDTIRVINTHLRSIHFEGEDYAAVKEFQIDNDSTVTKYSNITKKLKRAFIARAQQAGNIRSFLESSPYKVILSGDFNDSPTSYAYGLLRNHLKDAFVESGSGLGRTYVGQMPSFRIDYILHDPSFAAYNYYAKAFDFSDHKMISATIKIK